MLPRAIPIPIAATLGVWDVPQLQDIVQSGVLRTSQRAAESPAGGRDEAVSGQNGCPQYLAHASVPDIPACASGWGAASLLDCSSSAWVGVGCGQHQVPGAQCKGPQAVWNAFPLGPILQLLWMLQSLERRLCCLAWELAGNALQSEDA